MSSIIGVAYYTDIDIFNLIAKIGGEKKKRGAKGKEIGGEEKENIFKKKIIDSYGKT